MWPSTLYPENWKTFRYLKNAYDSYGRKKSVMGLDQTTQCSTSGSSTPNLEHRAKELLRPRHSLPSPSSTIFSSSSSETPSTPSSSGLLGMLSSSHQHLGTVRKQSMSRIFHYPKSFAHEVKHKLAHRPRLPKIESTESDDTSEKTQCQLPPSENGLTLSPPPAAPGRDSSRTFHHHSREHPPLYYRSSSPVFEQRLLYAASTRLHHSEPLGALCRSSSESPICGSNNDDDYLGVSGDCRRTSPSSKSVGHFFTGDTHPAFTRRSSQQAGRGAAVVAAQQRRLSYRSYDTEPRRLAQSKDETMADGARTVLLDKFASASDVPNRGVGGFTLCGGLEVGLPSIYISRVATNSAADKCNLRSGDQILSANYVSFLDGSITCKRAYEILDGNGSQTVLLTILPRGKTFAPRQRRHHCYSWIDPDGQPVSPPPPDRDRGNGEELNGGGNGAPDGAESHLYSRFRRAPRLRDLHKTSPKLSPYSSPTFKRKNSIAGEIRKVTITLEKGIDLGLMIRGGIEYGLGIYVTRVDANSLAEQANLCVGDQILSVNEFDFTEVLHDEAVDCLKSSARLNMRVLYVGKVPSSTYSAMDPANAPTAVAWTSPRHSPHHQSRYSGSPSNCPLKGPGSVSPRLARQSPHHGLIPLSHSNSSPTTASSASSARHHEALHQSHSYREPCISPHYGRKDHRPLTRDTPTLLITDHDNRNHPTANCDHLVDDDDDTELFVLTVDRAYGNSYHLRKRLQNSKSEEDDATLDEESMRYLNEKERLTLAYYRNEYVTKAMNVDTLVALLAELLDTNEKYSLIFRLYHVIRPEDVDRFDALAYNRTEHSLLKSKAMAEGKYSRFFKQESSESADTFDVCHSGLTTETSSSGFETTAGPVGMRMRADSVAPGNAPDCDYDTRADLSPTPPMEEGHHHHLRHGGYHLDLHENANRLARRESLLMRSSGNVVQKTPSPNSAAYRKTFMTRRHSSGTSDTPIVRDNSPPTQTPRSSVNNPLNAKPLSAFGSYPLVADERRWSIANAECRRPSVLFSNPTSDLAHRRAPSPLAFQPRADHQRSREDLEGVPNQQQRILSRKGSSASFCQETIPEGDDASSQLAPSSPTSTLASASGALRGSGNHLHVPALDSTGGAGGSGSDTEDTFGAQFPNHLRVRRHRSLPSPTFSTEKLLAANFPQHQRSNSFRLPSHRAVSEPNGRWRIKVKKTKPMLGIAIEGGENVTTQTQPRIISIHQSGAAIDCGDLRVGHIILEVDGLSTADMNHEQVAQMISRAYYSTPHKDYIEFLVREKNRNEFDLRRSSFMLLNNSFE